MKRDLRLKYRGSFFGYFWSLLEPLLLAAVYVVLYAVLRGDADGTYAFGVVIGVICWSFFSRSMMAGVTSLTGNANLIAQVYFPRELFAVTATASNFILATLSLFVAIPFMLWLGLAPGPHLLLIPLGLILLALLALGIGLLCAGANVINRDVQHFFRFVARAGMFISPVMWTYALALERNPVYAEKLTYNPTLVPIELVKLGCSGKEVLFTQAQLTYSVATCLIVFVLGVIVFRRSEASAVKKL